MPGWQNWIQKRFTQLAAVPQKGWKRMRTTCCYCFRDGDQSLLSSHVLDEDPAVQQLWCTKFWPNKNAQEMPLAIVAWHWRVASRWSGDDAGAGKVVGHWLDWYTPSLRILALEKTRTCVDKKKTTLKTYLQLPPAQKPKEPKKILLEHEWYSSQYGHCLVLSLILRVLCDLSNIIFQGDEHTKISQGW